jgi:hypothetical protein
MLEKIKKGLMHPGLIGQLIRRKIITPIIYHTLYSSKKRCIMHYKGMDISFSTADKKYHHPWQPR